MFSHQLRKGQSLLEVLVALGLAVAAVLGILALVTRATGLNRVTTDQYIASYLASEGIELVRNLFDHAYLVEADQNPGIQDFYGWAGSQCIIPGGCTLNSTWGHRVYIIGYDEQALTPVACGLSGTSVPTQSAVAGLMSSCTDSAFKYLSFDSTTGEYSYNAGAPSKFKRAIIIDYPPEYNDAALNLDYRVTSAVSWESRGGSFVVQLQDHFMPWRIP